MNFCSSCGEPVLQAIPPEDNRLRAICQACGTVHYENPKIILGTLSVWGAQVLLCRRAIEPRKGLWTLPAGFMELGESTLQGAERETQEESGADIDIQRLYALFDIPHIHQVYLFYFAQMRHPGLDPGPESLEARLFLEEDIPWEELAFRSTRQVLQLYFDDRRLGREILHTRTIEPPWAPAA